MDIIRKKLFAATLPTLHQRTLAVLDFNKQLENRINLLKNPNVIFVDITSFPYDHQLNRIEDAYFTKTDHHNFERNKLFGPIVESVL